LQGINPPRALIQTRSVVNAISSRRIVDSISRPRWEKDGFARLPNQAVLKADSIPFGSLKSTCPITALIRHVDYLRVRRDTTQNPDHPLLVVSAMACLQEQPTPRGVKAPVFRENTWHFRQESSAFETSRAAPSYHVVSISKIHPERALANASIRVLTSLSSL
jgi:hypothetical protein